LSAPVFRITCLAGHYVDCSGCQSVRNTLVKQGSSTTKKRNKYFFDVDDLANMPFTLWTEDGFIFIHDYMRDQMIFLMLAYCFTGARVGAYLGNGKTEVKLPDGKTDKLQFGIDDELGCPRLLY
jgi:hypothetical protein